MLRDFIAAGLMFVAVYLYIIAWPDMIMLGLLAAVIAIISVIVAFTGSHPTKEGTP